MQHQDTLESAPFTCRSVVFICARRRMIFVCIYHSVWQISAIWSLLLTTVTPETAMLSEFHILCRPQKVLISTCVDVKLRQSITKTIQGLGGSVTDSPEDFTVYLTLAAEPGAKERGFVKSLSALSALASGGHSHKLALVAEDKSKLIYLVICPLKGQSCICYMLSSLNLWLIRLPVDTACIPHER